MDDIGVSLFNDVGNLQFNSNDGQHQDEEEDQEERKRRDEEVMPLCFPIFYNQFLTFLLIKSD